MSTRTTRSRRSRLFASSAPATVRPAQTPASTEPASTEPASTEPPALPVLDEGTTAETLSARALDALRGVYDPELGLDIVAMGLVYDVRATLDADGAMVEVDMTLTTPGCPVSESLPLEADTAVRSALPGVAVHVQVVWDPPWTPERLDPSAMESLGLPPR